MKIKLKNSTHQPFTSGYLVSWDDLEKNFIPSRYDDARTVCVKTRCFWGLQCPGQSEYLQFCPFQSHPLRAANFSSLCEFHKRFLSKLSVSRYGALKYFQRGAKNDTSGFSIFFLGTGQNSIEEYPHYKIYFLPTGAIPDNLKEQCPWYFFGGFPLFSLSSVFITAVTAGRGRLCLCDGRKRMTAGGVEGWRVDPALLWLLLFSENFREQP